jgi:hypothetical protein
MLFWKAQKMEFKLCHNLLQNMKCTFKTLPSLAQVSESFADILQAQAKNFKLNCTVPCVSAVKEPPS